MEERPRRWDTGDPACVAIGVAALVAGLALQAVRGARTPAPAPQGAADALGMTPADYQALVRDSADVIAVTSGDGTVRFISPAVRLAWGHGPDDLIGQPLRDAVHPDDAELLDAYLATVAHHDRISDELVTRLRDHEGAWRAVEIRARRLRGARPASPDRDDHRIELVLNLRDVGERETLRTQLSHAALHDHLTGLANRALLRDRLQLALDAAARVDQVTAVLFIDLDDFKAVNDGLGHPIGDELLRGFADRLQRCTRPGDTAARLGGDEFAVILPLVHGQGEAIDVAERILDCLAEPFDITAMRLHLKASVGVACGTHDDGVDQLLRLADIAMYRAKEEGGNRVLPYRSGDEASSVARLRRASDLHDALERGELVPHYQPVVDLTDGSVMGVEALARWEHPTEGILSPIDFMALAESSGQLHDLDLAMLRAACTQLVAWDRTHTQVPEALWISVNLAARDVLRPGIVSDILSTIDGAGVAPGRVVIELTESALLRDHDAVGVQLEALRSEGLRIAIDDFGVGASALSYLQHAPIDVLKLDRSFVAGVDGPGRSAAIIGAIVDLARELDIMIVAEGIERSSQLAALQNLGCPLGQGYHLAEPATPDALHAVIGSRRLPDRR